VIIAYKESGCFLAVDMNDFTRLMLNFARNSSTIRQLPPKQVSRHRPPILIMNYKGISRQLCDHCEGSTFKSRVFNVAA
jgi:hypothetical protein